MRESAADFGENQVTIAHQDGVCVFQIARVELQVASGRLDLTVETHPNKDCVLGFLPPPTLYVEGALVSVDSLEALSEETLRVDFGWEDEGGAEKKDEIHRIYIGQHAGLDNNTIRIRRLDERRIRVEWTSDANDFNYYDHHAKRNSVTAHFVWPLVSSA